MVFKVLMIGLSRSVIPALARAKSEIEVYVLEEPNLIEHQTKGLPQLDILKEIRSGTYQQSIDFMTVVKQWHEDIQFDAVLAGSEYAVLGAGLVAKELGLRYLGHKAVSALTNKLRLRQSCAQVDIHQPRFTRVQSIADIYAFFKGSKIVIKPANRQASTGVIKIEQFTDIEPAYAKMIGATEGHVTADRPMDWDYMAEDYVPGLEFSVETIMQSGNAIFHNITAKNTTDSMYCVELGHVVPAEINPHDTKTLYAAQEKLIAALDAQDGFLHAEWKVADGIPTLIECAGRLAGDQIPYLIELAYGFNVYEMLIETLLGKAIALPSQSSCSVCIRYFEPEAGILKEIRGTEILQGERSQVVRSAISIQPGDKISPIESSWSRVGYFIVKGQDREDVNHKAQAVLQHIQFVVEPQSCSDLAVSPSKNNYFKE